VVGAERRQNLLGPRSVWPRQRWPQTAKSRFPRGEGLRESLKQSQRGEAFGLPERCVHRTAIGSAVDDVPGHPEDRRLRELGHPPAIAFRKGRHGAWRSYPGRGYAGAAST